jgi:two-component system KDP operon response regulator KdpE
MSRLPISAKPVRVLVAGGPPATAQSLRASLATGEYLLEEVPDLETAIGAIRRRPFHFVVLDSYMPGISGVAACRRIRKLLPHAGIVMIAVCDELEDKVGTLDAGADDYISRPFLLRELLARMRAVLRRAGIEQPPESEVLLAGDLELDARQRTLRKAGRKIHLSPTEFDLLAHLMRNCGIPIEHSKLLQTIWGPEYRSELEYLRSYIRFLRKKIESDPARPEYILTEPWIGYRFRDPSVASSPQSGD